MFQIFLVSCFHGSIDNGFLLWRNGRSIFITANRNHSLDNGHNVVGLLFQCLVFHNRQRCIVYIIFLVKSVFPRHIKRIDIVITVGRNLQHRTAKRTAEIAIFVFGVNDKNACLIIIKQHIQNLSLGSERFTRTRRTQHETRRRFHLGTIYDNKILRNLIQAVIETASLEQLLIGERHKDRGTFGCKCSLNTHFFRYIAERKCNTERFFLLCGKNL